MGLQNICFIWYTGIHRLRRFQPTKTFEGNNTNILNPITNQSFPQNQNISTKQLNVRAKFK